MMGHWRRLIVQLTILASMVVVNAIDQNIYFTLVSISIVILPVASWTVFALLLWTNHEAPDIQSLRDRVDDALTLALVSTVAAFIGAILLGRLLGIISAPIGGLISVAFGFIVVEVSFPAIGFLQTWRDLYLPMVRRKRAGVAEKVFEAEHESGMAAMEGRLSNQIAENTKISQEAAGAAKDAYQEANSVNLKINRQGNVIERQATVIEEMGARQERRAEHADKLLTITNHTAEQVDDIHDATVPERPPSET